MVDVKMVALMGNRDVRYSDIKEKLDAVRELYPDAMWISNGEVGTCLAATKFAMLNKIPLFMCIPFPPEIMTSKWLNGWRNVLDEALKYAQKVSIVSDVFSFMGYQICIERIIACADVVVTFNQDISSDSFDCIKFAKSIGKQVVDGFSLSMPKKDFYADFQNSPAKYGVIPTNSIPNSRRKAVYGNGALQIQHIIPLETVAYAFIREKGEIK